MPWLCILWAALIVASNAFCLELVDEVEERLAQVRRKVQVSTDAAIAEATKVVDDFPRDARPLEFRAALFEMAEKRQEAENDLTRAIELKPSDASLFHRRGEVRFRRADIAGSLADFDEFLRLNPQGKPQHWQRGIALYYAGRYAEGVEQFDTHQQVNSQDVENAVWRFLCMASLEGVDAARTKLIPINEDRRVPMKEIHQLFAGKAKPEDVLTAAERPRQLPTQMQLQRFYANLYLGLYFEAVGDAKKSAECIAKAVETRALGGYMGDVARVHQQLRRSGGPPAGVAPAAKPAPAKSGGGQNPSPMVEHSRAHPRLKQHSPPGRREKLKFGTLFIPEGLKGGGAADKAAPPGMPLFIHFHGGTWLPEVAATEVKSAVVSVQLGSGSQTYGRPFADSDAFEQLIAEAEAKAKARLAPIGLTAWSAGYGSIRAILATPKNYARVAFVILIDGMHTSYVGGKPGPLESKLETAGLQIFLQFARDAVAGKKRMLITHSEIFPGTFASTTETSDWLIGQLGLTRTPTLIWGPMGTQQLSEVRAGKLTIKGFAGNSAPDHVDQLHSLPEYLRSL